MNEKHGISLKQAVALIIYLGVIIATGVLIYHYHSMNHIIYVSMKPDKIYGADNYTMVGDRLIINYNGEQYTVDLVQKIETTQGIVGGLIVFIILWGLFGALVLAMIWEDLE